MESYERKPYYAKADEFDTITSGDTIKLKSLFASGMMKLSTEKRIQEIRKDTIVSVHIRKCINYIYEDFNADLSIKGLANLTGLNETYLAKLFKKETGQTVKNYVTSAKIDTAQNLLKYSDLSIAIIAASLGYSSQSAFTYAFRRFTGMAPKKYRKMNYVVKF